MGKKFESEAIDLLMDCVLSMRDKQECYDFFEDLCTIKELQDISQRVEVAQLLLNKKKYQEIAAKTGASTATISRVNRSLMYGNDSYEKVLARVAKKEETE
ncbi:MAG: YerC/YecD family TrpR-related protein [Lachnospiraceae bacterium]